MTENQLQNRSPKIGNWQDRLGLTVDFAQALEAAKKNQQLQVEFEGERIRSQYGAVSDNDVWQILRAEKELTQCKGCNGLPCQKRTNRNFKVKISYNAALQSVDIRSNICEYEKARLLQRQLEKMQGLSKIPAEYLGKTFADYQVDSGNSYAVEVAKKLIERTDKGAYFYGSVGTGKTLLAAIIAQEVIRRGRQVIFCTVPQLSRQIRSTFNNDSKTTEAEILEQLETAPTLILDDVGMEKPTRFVCSTLCSLFNERYNARLQTIMTSNYPLKELESIFNNPTDGGVTLDGTRIYSRCKTMCAPVEIKGKDRRA